MVFIFKSLKELKFFCFKNISINFSKFSLRPSINKARSIASLALVISLFSIKNLKILFAAFVDSVKLNIKYSITDTGVMLRGAFFYPAISIGINHEPVQIEYHCGDHMQLQ